QSHDSSRSARRACLAIPATRGQGPGGGETEAGGGRSSGSAGRTRFSFRVPTPQPRGSWREEEAGGRAFVRHGEGRAAAAEPRGAGGGRGAHGLGHGVAAQGGGHIRVRHPRHRWRAAPGLGVLRPGLLPVAHPHARLPTHGRGRGRRPGARRLEIQALSSQGGHADDHLRVRSSQVVDVRI
ncbi:Putative pentatricopeptide repeat-containing protein, partial [Zea mays]